MCQYMSLASVKAQQLGNYMISNLSVEYGHLKLPNCQLWQLESYLQYLLATCTPKHATLQSRIQHY